MSPSSCQTRASLGVIGWCPLAGDDCPENGRSAALGHSCPAMTAGGVRRRRRGIRVRAQYRPWHKADAPCGRLTTRREGPSSCDPWWPMRDSRASVATPESISEASRLLSTVEDSAPLAGGTWIMRRNGDERTRSLYVSLPQIPALRELDLGPSLRLGASVTHSSLASALSDVNELAGLRDAAGRSANPAVRNMATIGGGLAATTFPSSDLVPALLALDAGVETAGGEAVPLEAFLAERAAQEKLITAVVVPARPVRSAHVRLLLRAAGDY